MNHDQYMQALIFAAEKHATQTRKDPRKMPYIVHPIGVADLIICSGCTDPDIIRAALLHDVLEDTVCIESEIEERFGERVLSLVKEVTDDKSLPKAERKLAQLKNAPDKSDGATLIKLADKIYNMRDIILNPIPEWNEETRLGYIAWNILVLSELPHYDKHFKSIDYLSNTMMSMLKTYCPVIYEELCSYSNNTDDRLVYRVETYLINLAK